MISRNNEVALYENLAAVTTEKDPAKVKGEIDTLIQGGVDDKTITPKQAEALRKTTWGNWIRTDVWRRATTIVRPDGEVDWSETVKWFSQKENIKGIDSAVIDGLLEDANSQLTQQKKRDNENIENLKTEANKQLSDLMDFY